MSMEVQIGGVRESLLDFLQKTKPFQVILVYIVLIIVIIFKQQISPAVYEQFDSLLGRLFAVFLITVLTLEYGWVVGLLSALAVSLLIGLPKPYSQIQEGFGSGGETAVQVVPTRKKWFVERALHENPIAIEEEKVVTSPVQNDSPSGVSGGVQNTSVT